MENKSLEIPVSASLGTVSAAIVLPNSPKAVLTFAHGAGAGMRHMFMEALAQALGDRGIGTVRFNFPYMEKGKKRPDPPVIAEKTVESVIQFTHEAYSDYPLFCGGKSFGGRMTSQRLAKDCASFVRGIVFFGFPLHAAGVPAVERGVHLQKIGIPMLFLQGTRDALANIDLIKKVCDDLPMATLYTIEGADHSFKVSRKEDAVAILAQETSRWIDKII